MNACAVGRIGGGRIVRIILTGWERAHRPLSDIVVTDTDAAYLERLQADFPAIAVSQDNNRGAVAAPSRLSTRETLEVFGVPVPLYRDLRKSGFDFDPVDRFDWHENQNAARFARLAAAPMVRRVL
jgi:hypothetical protein